MAEPIGWWSGAVVILLVVLCAGLGWELWGLRAAQVQLAEEKAVAWELNDALLAEMARWRAEADGLLEDRRLLLKQIDGAAGHLAAASLEKKRLLNQQAVAAATHLAREQDWESYGNVLETSLGATRQTLSRVSQEAVQQQQVATGQMVSLKGQLSELNASHASLASQAKQTEQRAEILSAEKGSLERCKGILQQEVQRLEQCTATLRSHNVSLASEVNCLKSEVSRLESRIQCLTSELQEAKR